MAAASSSPDQPSRVVLFGGQGSQSLFSAAAAKLTEDFVKSSVTGARLLSKCHTAFLEDLSSIITSHGEEVGLDQCHFSSSKDLITPFKQYQTHGIIQATTICLYQLLHYLADLEKAGTSVETAVEELSETTGFCSGMLPAVVVASSRTQDRFLQLAVGAFRLAFWIGWRVTIASSGIQSEEKSWSLVISGLSKSQVEEQLQNFNSKVHGGKCRVSVVSRSSGISVSGPPHELLLLKDQLTSLTAFAYVHSWYHGGEQLETVVQKTLRDIKEHNILFPSTAELQKPIRSTLDGKLFEPHADSEENLPQWIIRHLLVHCVDWSLTSQGICQRIDNGLQDERTSIRVMSFGPSTEFLLAEIRSTISHSRLELVDASPFRSVRAGSLQTPKDDDIAIVGMGLNLPEGKGAQQLWETLLKGISTVQEIPESRFKLSDYYATEESGKGRTMPIQYGSFIDDIWTFDNGFFNISPREAISMDPQQRLLLHTTQAALDDAGYVKDSTPTFQRATMGCYIGIATGDYTDNLRDSIDVFYAPGTLRAFHSGKISYVYKLSGPSIVTDTACSSSMVSIYQACQALRNGECSSAIAGGANTISSPDMYLGLARGHFLSPTGGCKPFDEAADGYCRAEGCGVFVLKRLSDALAENDRIHGVIRGVAVNQSGNAHSITHPHSETQVQLYQELLKKSEVDPSSISVVEAHGTGTQAGDVREIASLDTVFGKYHSKTNPLTISSIKGNIGHCEAASGAASLAKLLLMLQRKEILSQASLNNLNPRIDGLQHGGLVIPRENGNWRHSPYAPRRAVINNFGAAGSNAALLLEEHLPARRQAQNVDTRSAYTFGLSAKSRDALKRTIEDYIRVLCTTPARLEDLCYTATARRELYEYRAAVTCDSIDDLRYKLSKVDTSVVNPVKTKRSVVFVFSGQGCIHHGMGQELMRTSRVFRDIVVRCDHILEKLGFSGVSDFISGRGRNEGPSSSSSEQVITAQCACVALEYAVAKLLISFGVFPDYMIGHSLGEYAALAVSKALSLEDTLRAVATRAQLMFDRCAPNSSGMLACKLSPSKTDRLLAEHHELHELSVACRNSEDDCVVSGPLAQIKVLDQICSDQKIKRKQLDVPYGYHSAAMEPLVEPLKELSTSIRWSAPRISVVSTVSGRIVGLDELKSAYLASHARRPVVFSEAVQYMKNRGAFDDTACLEIGPHPITLPMIQPSVDPTACSCIALLKKDKANWSVLSSALSQLFLQGDGINWRETFQETQAKLVDLPSYPLMGSTFANAYTETPSHKSEHRAESSIPYRSTGFNLLPRLSIAQDTKDQFIFETSMAVLSPLISGHSVGGTAICPASVFQELVLEAAQTIYDVSDPRLIFVQNMSFANPLIDAGSDDSQVVNVRIDKTQDEEVAEFRVTTKTPKQSIDTICCSGTVAIKNAQQTKQAWLKDAAIVKRQRDHLLTGQQDQLSKFQTKVLYENVFTRVVRYSEPYQSIESLHVSEPSKEAIGTFKLRKSTQIDGRICPPAFTDTLLHAAGFVANMSVNLDEICICGKVDSVEVLYHDTAFEETFTVYCSLVDIIKGSILADSWAVNSAGEVVAVVRGMEFKKLKLDSFQRFLRHATSSGRRPSHAPVRSAIADNSSAHPIKPSYRKNSEAASTTQTSEVDEQKRIRTVLSRLVSQVSGFREENLDFSSPLEALGIDSMMEIELASKLKDEVPGHNIDHNELSACETLHDIERVILTLLNIQPTKDTADNVSDTTEDNSSEDDISLHSSRSSMIETPQEKNPVALHISPTSAPPLCLFHDGSGLVQMYSKIKNFDRSTYGFYEPHFVEGAPQFSTLVQMATQYAMHLSTISPPSVILAGWSFGGVVAFEVAQQLRRLGIEVMGLILIDSPYPVQHRPLPDEVITHITRSGSTGSALAKEFRRNASLLASYQPEPLKPTEQLRTVMLRSQDTLDTEDLCGVRYEWLSSQDARDKAVAGWEGLVGGRIESLPIQGNHFEAFTPENIESTSTQLWAACKSISL